MTKIKEFKTVFSEDEIQERVKALGKKITEDYGEQELICICTLSGAFMFFTDLVKNINNPNLKVDFLRVSSYGGGTVTSGQVNVLADIHTDIRDKNVLVIEDLIDSGLTMSKILKMLKDRGAKSVKLCAFIDKTERREADIKIDYHCFDLKSGFIVGYGMDYDGRYRQLPAVYEAVLED